jgi:indolepyruvate ferredoxin oxidoreductase alpha subunit
MMGDVSNAISIPKVLEAIGLTKVVTVDPLSQEEAMNAVKELADLPGVKAIIFKSPCVAIVKTKKSAKVDRDRCIGCKKCINELGCPALYMKDGRARIDKALCTDCGLCKTVCPVKCIKEEA